MVPSQQTAGPTRTKLTYREYVLFPADGNRHEIIEGRHYMNAAPNPRHQTVSRFLQFQLFELLERKGLAQVFNAPIDLQLTEWDVVQPDLVVVLTDNDIVTPSRIRGVPDLIVEILSPTNREYDEGLKKQLYEQSLVPELWIVDPDERSVQQYLLQPDGRYGVPVCCADQISFDSVAGTVTVDLRQIWH